MPFQDKLLTLAGECEVWPGHLGGSLCGGPGMDMKPSSTIAYELAHNKLLALADEEAFVRATTSAVGPQPPNFQAIVARNRGPLVTGAVEIQPLTPRQVEHKQGEGALIVDATKRSCSSAATTPTRSTPRTSPPPSRSATSPATSPAA